MNRSLQICDTWQDLGCAQGSAVALGFFDGIHIGHQSVIRAAVECARAEGLAAGVFTFRLPLSHRLKGGRLETEGDKRRVMEQLGVQVYLEPPFEAVRDQSPEEFVDQILVGAFRAKAVFCGDNFTFGKKAAGNVDTLRTLCAARGIRVVQVTMALWQGQNVSSTRIRAALEAGDVAAANAMLGRPYRIDFPVKHGQGLGHTLGFPTINQVFPEGFIQPRYGIYITRVQVDGMWYPGATGLGTRPTVNLTGKNPTCETFIPGFAGNLYGAQPVLEFYEYLAPSRKFASVDELRACVQDAAAKATAYFAPGGAGYAAAQPGTGV